MKLRACFLFISVIMALTGCQSAVSVDDTPVPEPVRTAATLVDSPTPTLPPSPTFTATHLPATSTPTPSQTPTSLPENAIQLYSPLAEHTIEQLFEIVSSPYDPPPPGEDARHHGVDFCYYQGEGRDFIEGEVVNAILSGRVVASQADELPYGNMVIIETAYEELPEEIILGLEIESGESLYHLYAHFKEVPEVALGERVVGGQALGQVGKTGYNIVVSHLHFETRLGPSGAIFDSMVYYDVTAAQEERDAYELWRTSGTFRHFDPMDLFSSLVP
ncbi:MAG: M23 family metallopeptidase [Chloroflexota bacterium]|nr:M23 family metallopeptidase [Chloroflexota bacterium]